MKSQNPFSHLNCDFIIRKSQRARKISLRIKPPQTVTLTVPYNSSVKNALRFATEHEQWVNKKLEQAKQKTANQSQPITSKDKFNTKFHQFQFIPHNREDCFARIQEQETLIYYPKQLNESDEQVQQIVKLAIRETYRIEAKNYLPERIERLANKHGFSYNKVSIRDSKGRWGSCSAQKNISLSLSLMKLPWHLIDYILLHELCHTVEMNHSERFHTLLNQVCGGKSKAFIKELKSHALT